MENKDRLLVALLIVSISFNVYSLVRTNALEEDLKLQMDGLANAIHSRLNSVVGQVSDVSYQVGKIAQEQEWLLKDDFALNLDKSGPGQAYLLLDFTLREVEEGARALVHYRVADGLDWTAVAAEAIGGNTFRAELAVSGDSVYQYKVQVNERVSEEKHIPSDFYVAGHIYPQINGVARGDKVQLDLWLNSTGNILLNPPVRIKVNYYNDANLVRTETVYQGMTVTGESGPWQGPYQIEFGSSLTHIDLEVMYQDGSLDSGRIWPGTEYIEIIKSGN